MAISIHRRRFIRASATMGAFAGLGDLSFLRTLPPVMGDETAPTDSFIRLRPEIEPLVRLLEETPRDKLLEEIGQRIRNGLSYREILAALLLAGVKNIEPRPQVGFKFHAVLVVNSAHLASLSSPAEHRWLPIFWALDYYKEAEAKDVVERGDWTMKAVDESAVPKGSGALAAFRAAMDNWDESAADVAVAGLARSAGVHALAEEFYRYGCRDFRSIGHKAIFVANSFRTLEAIGWEHAEPILRSLAYALLMHEGDNPSKRDNAADRHGRENLARLERIRAEWKDGKADSGATLRMLETLRSGSADDACELVVEMLNANIAPQSIWDALHLGAAELLMRQPGIVALHAVTTTNALSFAFRACGDDATRRLLLLQNAAFVPLFRNAMTSRGQVKDLSLADLAAAPAESPTIASIFQILRSQPMTSARQTFQLLKSGGSIQELIDAARVLVFLKGDDAHDYKFSSAVLEDCQFVSPEFRPQYLAANVLQLRSSTDPDSNLVQRTRAALG